MSKNAAKAIIILAMIPLLIFVAVYVRLRIHVVQPKIFECGNMSIELNDLFVEQENPTMTATFTNGKVTVMVGHALESTDTLEDYTQRLITGLSQLENVTITQELNSTERGNHFCYRGVEANGDSYIYATYSYETSTGLWTIQFVCNEKDYENQLTNIEKWEKTVQFR